MSPLLACQGITKNFGGLTALTDINLQVEQKEVVGIIGPNGAGKTTLFNIISGAIPPTQGQILFKGREISSLPSNQVCRLGIARTYQLVRPFNSLTALENVLVGVTFGRS
jgi:branched-chain amino acid transport system ATP-binding protein